MRRSVEPKAKSRPSTPFAIELAASRLPLELSRVKKQRGFGPTVRRALRIELFKRIFQCCDGGPGEVTALGGGCGPHPDRTLCGGQQDYPPADFGLGHATVCGALASRKRKPGRSRADIVSRRSIWLISTGGLGQKSQNTGTQRKASPSTDTRPIDGNGRCVATRSSPVPASSLSSWMRTRAASSGSCSNPL